MKHVLVEGWRGISQSYAMVNQYQLNELARIPGISLQHRDLPFFRPYWNTTDDAPGFPEAMRHRIAAIPQADRDEYDCVYSISSPHRKSLSRAGKVLTFMTGEFGLRPDSFLGSDCDIDYFCHGANKLVVPSEWSKMKVMEFGFPEQKIEVIPHGVDSSLFYPLGEAERRSARQQLGFREDDFLFLNLGAMTWNKGIDILVRAFASLRSAQPRARLLLKDGQHLYGISAENVVKRTLADFPDLMTEDFRKALIFISQNLGMPQLRLLLGMADVYVAPYRAEGFNLPVLESIACGTPVIVTRGGATDDFCSPPVSHMVASSRVDTKAMNTSGTGYHLEADIADLTTKMHEAMAGTDRFPNGKSEFETARQRLVTESSWAACTGRLAVLMCGE